MIKLFLLVATFTSFLVSTLFLWRGIFLTNDKLWKEHVERCAAQGLHPERNAYWERGVRWGRFASLFAGVSFLFMGGMFLHIILSAPYRWWVWW
jgi:hypothetical protein